jgi:GTP-binding protein
MADIPGIIEGASNGKGLGLQFLKHIQRTRLIVYMIDVITPDISETLKTLQDELKNFDASLLKRPFIVVLNKIDLIDDEQLKVISDKLDKDYIPISAVTGKGKKKLLNKIEHELAGEK